MPRTSAALRQLGRRPGNNPTRDTILDAAEETFARSGYAGTSLREIADRAGVNQALLHHYFGSKDGLFKAIFLRRGQELGRERLELLDLLEKRSTPPTLEEIVRAYLIPAFNMKRRSAGGVAFLRLQAQLQLEPSPGNLELRTLVHEESMQRFIAAFKRAVPQLDARAVYWRTVFMVGAFQYTISDSHRLDVLSHGECNATDPDEAFAQLVLFLVGGLERKP
jgi:AcrR family transcriptional regulator